MEWALWKDAEFSKPDGGLVRVGLHRVGLFVVSSVFLGLDHGRSAYAFDDNPPPGYRPVVFETAIFPRHELNELGMWRWRSWFEAQAAQLFVVRHMIHNRRWLELAYMSGDKHQRERAFARVLAGLPTSF